MAKKQKKLQFITNLVLLLCLSGIVFAASSPTALVKKSIDDILSVLNNKSLDQTQRRIALDKEIRRVVKERFEFQTMSKSVLSTNWRKATGYEQDRFVDFFTETLVNTYFSAIESYNGEEIKYVGETIKDDRAVVDTVIVAKNGDIPITYKMKLTDDEWYVYDVVIEHISLVSNYRNLYTAIIKSSGINGLLAKLEKGLKKQKANAGK
jgi:phospholipid transport system substrate-binding protein